MNGNLKLVPYQLYLHTLLIGQFKKDQTPTVDAVQPRAAVPGQWIFDYHNIYTRESDPRSYEVT